MGLAYSEGMDPEVSEAMRRRAAIVTVALILVGEPILGEAIEVERLAVGR
jgi:hypothetical protein